MARAILGSVIAVVLLSVVASPAAMADSVAQPTSGPADPQGHLIRWVVVDYPKGQDAARTGQYIRVVLQSVGNPTSIQINTVPIGGQNNTLMFDDGQHDDGGFGDQVWGTNAMLVRTNLTVGFKRLMIYLYNGANLIDTGSVSVGVDNWLPTLSGPRVIYPVGQTHAKEGDLVRFIVKVNDTAPRLNVDAILVIDRSGSMCIPSCAKMQAAKDGSKAFVDQLKPLVDRAALFSFSNTVTKDQDYTTDKPLIKSRIDALNASGATALYGSVFDCVNYAKAAPRKGAIAACVVLTDGKDTVGNPTLQDVLNLLAVTPEIPVFTIGLGAPADVDSAVLTAIAQASDGGQYFYAPNPSDLAAIYDAIVNLLINRPYPQSVAKVLVNTTLFAKTPTLEPLFDDGMHGDEVAGDEIYGSEWIAVNTKKTETLQVPIHAWDGAFNANQTTVDLRLDNTAPTIGPIDVTYVPGAKKAKDGEPVTVTARDVKDSLLRAGGTSAIEQVVLNATSIGSGRIVMTGSGGTYTATDVLVATGGAMGEFPIDVTAYDSAGNTATEDGLVVVDNDLTPPKVVIVAPAPEAYVKHEFRIEATALDEGPVTLVSAAVTKDGAGAANGTMDFDSSTGRYGLSLNADNMADGTYEVIVTAVDDSGNPASSTPVKFRVDNTAPALAKSSPASTERLQGDVTFKFTATDLFAVTRLELQKDGGAPMPLDLNSGEAAYAISTKPQDNGVHSLKLMAWDENGNLAELEVIYTVDNYSWTPAIWGVFVLVGVLMLFLLMLLTKPKQPAANRKQGGV